MKRIDRNLVSAAVTWVVIIYLLTVLGGCGGGTSGTGLGAEQTTYVGAVMTPVGDPVPGARIENQATGDATLTDMWGAFALATKRTEGDVPFKVETSTLSSEFIVEQPALDSPQVSVNITLDVSQGQVAVDRFSVDAGIVGACNSYFENRSVIRQANRVPAGQACTAKITVYGDGKPRGHIPVAVQRSSCIPGAQWETVAIGETLSGVHRGVAQVSFPFEDSMASCRYRIVAPFEYREYVPVIYTIETFTSQGIDKNTPPSAATP